MSKVAKIRITRVDRQILREDVEYLLKHGTRDEYERVTRALRTAVEHAELKKNGFKIKRNGSAFTIIPPKKPTKMAQFLIECLAEERKQLATRLFGSALPTPPVQFAEPIPLLKQAAAIEKYLAGLKGNEFNRSFPFADDRGEVGVSMLIDITGFAFCETQRLGRPHTTRGSNVHVTFMANTPEKATLTIEFAVFSVGLGARWTSSQGDGSIKATGSMDSGRFELEVRLRSARNGDDKYFDGAGFTAPTFKEFHNSVNFDGDIPDFAKAAMTAWAIFFLDRELRDLFVSAVVNCLALLPRAVLPRSDDPTLRAVVC